MSDVAQFLQKGLELISRPNGWHQGSLYKTVSNAEYDGLIVSYCIIGALTAVKKDFGWDVGDQAIRLLRRIVHQKADMSLPDWNDAKGRTVEEVKELLLEAIKFAEERDNGDH